MKPRTETSRSAAIHAVVVLNYLVGDLVIPTRVREDYAARMAERPVHPDTAQAINRFCISHLTLALSKWVEFYSHYSMLIPTDCLAECKRLNADLEKRQLRQFRNTIVGHIWHKAKNRPLTNDEIESAFQTLVKQDAEEFVAWCNNPQRNIYPNTVVSVVEHVRDRIMLEFSILESEVLGAEHAT